MRNPDFDVNKNCFVLYRNITNLDDNLSHRRAQKFTDIKPGTNTYDADARKLLTDLKASKIPKFLSSSFNQRTFDVTWTDLDNDPSDNEEYLQQFCDAFRELMLHLIAVSAKQADQLNKDPYVVEVIQHLTMCKTRCVPRACVRACVYSDDVIAAANNFRVHLKLCEFMGASVFSVHVCNCVTS